jgi:calcineurin-like phosphoesterase family protein
MSKKLYISDTHFGHANIIKLTNRPFESVFEMDEVMIERWNNAVGKNDLVYHLGDFAWNNVEDYRWYLNGHIILIHGSHDRLTKKQEKGLFSAVYYYKIIKDNGIGLVLFHYPILSWDGLYKGKHHLHGHSHNHTFDVIEGKEHQNKGRRINICVEQPVMDYTPRTLEEILNE